MFFIKYVVIIRKCIFNPSSLYFKKPKCSSILQLYFKSTSDCLTFVFQPTWHFFPHINDHSFAAGTINIFKHNDRKTHVGDAIMIDKVTFKQILDNLTIKKITCLIRNNWKSSWIFKIKINYFFMFLGFLNLLVVITFW